MQYIVLLDKRNDRLYIDIENYMKPTDVIVRRFEDLDKAKDAYPQAKCLVRQKRNYGI